MGDRRGPRKVGDYWSELPTFAGVLQSVQGKNAFPAVLTPISGAEHTVELSPQCVVGKAVYVHVPIPAGLVGVQKGSNGPLGAESLRAVAVELHTSCIVEVGIGAGTSRFFGRNPFVRLNQFDIDLAGHALKSVGYGTNSLGQLDAFDPGSGNKLQPAVGEQTAHERRHFSLNLRVLSVESEQLNLARTRHCIGKRCVDGRIGFKALRQVAAGGLLEFALPNRGGKGGGTGLNYCIRSLRTHHDLVNSNDAVAHLSIRRTSS